MKLKMQVLVTMFLVGGIVLCLPRPTQADKLIDPATLTATASSFYGSMTPNLAVDGSGLTDDAHTSNAPQMWMTANYGANISSEWFRVDLGAICYVAEMKFWNYNQNTTNNLWTRGIQTADVYVSTTGTGDPTTDPSEWTLLLDDQFFTQAPSTNGYNTPDIIPMGAWAQYVHFALITNYGAGSYSGISEVQFFGPTPTAGVEYPADEATDVLRDEDVVLSWTPGMYADKHDVYFGTGFNDVNDATTTVDPAGVYMGRQSETLYALDRLVFGQTYYWRVDEVNAPPTSHIEFKGEVWSFTVEPIAYPIAGENITATASSVLMAEDMSPENTVNGSGLNANDMHSTEMTAMWLSSPLDPNAAWIQYELDRVYKLHQMWVWNSNSLLESFSGFGVKDAAIEYSVDGNDYTTLDTTHEFARAPGAAGYAPNTTVDFGGAAAKYVRITVNSNWGGPPLCGLSEVRFFYIPVWPREPNPASGATDVGPDVTLSWRAGREAAEHDVYISTDEQAVIDSNVPVSIVTEAGDPISLDLDETYYWKVNEVNMAETPTSWEGDVWNFTTPEYLVVDDFELYNDLNPDDPDSNRIFNTWIDGYDNPAINGSVVGHADAPFAEQSIVFGGDQSMPFFYDNTGAAAYSEAERTFAVSQDWTANGIKTLSLNVFGGADNSGQLYLKINSTRVVCTADIKLAGWQPWIIDLSTVGGNLQNVTQLTIGVENTSAIGVLYIDDIRLYPKAVEFVTPTEPNSTNLLAHYIFDGDVTDSSGNGHHGEEKGEPVYGDGVDGQAMQFDGVDDYVDVELDVPENGCTVAFWFKTTNPDSGLYIVVETPLALSGSGFDRELRLTEGNVSARLWGTTAETITAVGLNVADGQWHHVAHTYGDAVGGQKLYVDGLLLASGTKAQSDFDWQERVHFGFAKDGIERVGYYLEGMLDDARIYDRTLTPAEIAWLAGRTEPMVKPF